MTITGRVNRISAARVEAALADGDLRGVVTALTLGSSWWADEAARRVSLVKACSADGECVCGPPEECPLRSNAAIAQHALGELAQQVVAGQLLLASGTLGAMQLLALLRAAFRWRQHAAAEAFMALAAEPGAPQLPLAWWRDLLLMVLRSSVPQQLPALRGIVAMCNRVAAREGQPALPPAPNCRSKSVVNAAFPGRRQHAAAPFAAVMQVLLAATGIAEHVRMEDVWHACDCGCLPELLRLGPPPSPATSQLAWDNVLRCCRSALLARYRVPEAQGAPPVLDEVLPVYVRFAGALDALLAAGHRPLQLWGVQLGALETPAQRLAAYDALLATRVTRMAPLQTLDWLAALAASGLEWSPASHSRWPPAVQAAVIAAFGPAICQPAPEPAAAAAAASASRTAARARSSAPARNSGPSSRPTAPLRQLPAELQERIAGMVVRPISQWLALPGGALGNINLL